jgi:hypothetical protein
MKRFAAGIVGLVTSIVLFAGFSVVNWLSSDEALKFVSASLVQFVKDYKPFLYSTIILLFTLQQVWLRWPKPASLADIQELKGIIEPFLAGVLEEYYKAAKSISQTVASVRINVMLPTWRRFRFGRYLKIYYCSGGPVGLVYKNDELDLVWKRGQGTCGEAWKKEWIVVYDSAAEGLTGPKKSLTQKQIGIVGNINSVLSLPIRHSETKKVVGVLNLDSIHNVDKTFFNAEQIVNAVTARSGPLSMMLCTDGVKFH